MPQARVDSMTLAGGQQYGGTASATGDPDFRDPQNQAFGDCIMLLPSGRSASPPTFVRPFILTTEGLAYLVHLIRVSLD